MDFSGIEVAAARVFDEPVFQAILPIALLNRSFMKKSEVIAIENILIFAILQNTAAPEGI